MRWRLYISFLSATAAFCFMLLTAVTDHGSRGKYQPPMVSAAVNAKENVLPRLSIPVSAARVAKRSVRTAIPAFEHQPAPARIFVAHDADPVMARHEAEREERANRGKPAKRYRLKWDENGWFREEVALVTAYCPCSKCCGTHSPGITSIGKDAWTPGLAADPECLNYGTKVMVPGYGISNIDDTGGAMRRHWRRNGLLHIDVRMTYHYEAREWGKQYLRVKIYEDS